MPRDKRSRGYRNKMHITIQSKQTEARPGQNFKTEIRPRPRKDDRQWKPEPCGFTRKELHDLVAQMVG
jgi:hypothetical protein